MYYNTAVSNGLSTQGMFKLCASFNPCIEDNNPEDEFFIGLRPIEPGSLVQIEAMFVAMLPGNIAIVQYNPPRGGLGHYVTLWSQRNVRNELWYFYFNSIGEVKLYCGRTIADRALDIDRRCGSRRPSILMELIQDKCLYFHSLKCYKKERKQ